MGIRILVARQQSERKSKIGDVRISWADADDIRWKQDADGEGLSGPDNRDQNLWEDLGERERVTF